MNKKVLFCGAIAAALLLTACVKKEAPKEDEKAQVEPEKTQKTEQVNEPVQLQPLDSTENTPVEEPPKHVEIERHETANTTTEIRREVRNAPQHAATQDTKTEAPKPVKTETPKPVKTEAPKAEEKVTPAKAVKANSDAQSEDDAVAAAIAAATPALEK